MTARIYFFSPLGYAPMKDAHLKLLISGSHGWQDDEEEWVFGVVEAREGIHPADIRAHMEKLGIIALPPMSSQVTADAMDSRVLSSLSKWILPSDRTAVVAEKLGKMHPILRPVTE